MALEITDTELDLSIASARDFTPQNVIVSHENWAKFTVRCSLDNASKWYTVTLLFCTDEASRAAVGIEKEISMKLKNHKNISVLLTSFVDNIPVSYIELLAKDYLKFQNKKGCFLVYSYYPQTLAVWLSSNTPPLKFEMVLSFAIDILKAMQDIAECDIMLKLSIDNLRMDEDGRVVLADITMTTAHAHYDCASQASFAAGYLINEIIAGAPPSMSNTVKDSIEHPQSYPNSFLSIVRDLMSCDLENRITIREALNQLKICCSHRRKQFTLVFDNVEPKSDQGTLESTATKCIEQGSNERIVLEQKQAVLELKRAELERDQAASEMERMSEQCIRIGDEFQSMADHCELLTREIEQLRVDRDSAVVSSQSAYAASELLREQLSLVTRERDLAQTQIEELREIVSTCQPEEEIMDCTCCHKFFLESQNMQTSCNWHTGKYLFNRWSCCYKREGKATGCRRGQHKARPHLKDYTYDEVAP